jgi:hypothetical protein
MDHSTLFVQLIVWSLLGVKNWENYQSSWIMPSTLKQLKEHKKIQLLQEVDFSSLQLDQLPTFTGKYLEDLFKNWQWFKAQISVINHSILEGEQALLPCSNGEKVTFLLSTKIKESLGIIIRKSTEGEDVIEEGMTRQNSSLCTDFPSHNLWSFEMRGPVILKSDFVCEFKLIKIVLTTHKWLRIARQNWEHLEKWQIKIPS